MNSCRLLLTSTLMLMAPPAGAVSLDQKSVDELLSSLGADNQYDPAKGINWSVLPGPFIRLN